MNNKVFLNEESKKAKTEVYEVEVYDNVNCPSHYTEGRKYEPIDVIVDWGLNFPLGNTVKYISRAGRKLDYLGQDPKAKKLEDLKKAEFYLNYEINRLEEGIKND